VLSAICAAAAEVKRVLLDLFARLGVEDDLAQRYPAVVAGVGALMIGSMVMLFGGWVWFRCGRVIHAADLLVRSVEPPESSDLAGGNLYV
jgi:hypothetical protein